jgi:hypothetical protein
MFWESEDCAAALQFPRKSQLPETLLQGSLTSLLRKSRGSNSQPQHYVPAGVTESDQDRGHDTIQIRADDFQKESQDHLDLASGQMILNWKALEFLLHCYGRFCGVKSSRMHTFLRKQIIQSW